MGTLKNRHQSLAIELFAEFIEKYGGHYMTDMYAAGFYPFPSEEARWGYWSKHALLNRFDPPALPLYQELYSIVKDKDYLCFNNQC